VELVSMSDVVDEPSGGRRRDAMSARGTQEGAGNGVELGRTARGEVALQRGTGAGMNGR
jgi:hypothetical protein